MPESILDDELTIETPERVELRYVLASVGNRFLAAFIDHIAQIVLIIGVLLGLNFLVERTNSFGLSPNLAAALFVLLLFGIYWGYFVLFETIWSGQTPGKKLMKLRVIREDGRPVRFFEVFVRNLLRVTIDFLPPPSFATGVVSIIFSERSKRIGDFVAGTVVIKERATEAPSLEQVLKYAEGEQKRLEPIANQPFKTDTRILNAQEVRAIESFLKRRYELPDDKRALLATRIARSIASKLSLVNLTISPEAFLEEVDRQYRYQNRYSE